MSNEILLYILMVGEAYLEIGLIMAFILWSTTFDANAKNRVTIKELIFTIFFHPIVIYYFIKEFNEISRRK